MRVSVLCDSRWKYSWFKLAERRSWVLGGTTLPLARGLACTGGCRANLYVGCVLFVQGRLERLRKDIGVLFCIWYAFDLHDSLLHDVVQVIVAEVDAFASFGCSHAFCHLHGSGVADVHGGLRGR